MAHTIWRDQEDYIKDEWQRMEDFDRLIRRGRFSVLTCKPVVTSVRQGPAFKPRVRVKAISRRMFDGKA